jgi:hypothetical protein
VGRDDCFFIGDGIQINETGFFNTTGKKPSVASQIIFWTGFASMVASIPLFIAYHRNKKKSMSLSFKNETVPQLQNRSFTNRAIPSLSLKISL